MNIIWSEQARRDLLAVRDFIARDSEFYAEQQITRLIQRVEYISKMPTMGHRVHEHPQLSMRETHEGNYRIIYTFMNEEMQVITIVYMKQVLRRRRLK